MISKDLKMQKENEGLNYVPMLTQSLTPPNSGRSAISLHRNRSQRSILCFNGNYEGDISMFREKSCELERLSLLDSESDEDLARNATVIATGKVKTDKKMVGFIWRLIQFLLIKCLKPEMSEKVFKHLEDFKQSYFYHKLSIVGTFFFFVISYGFYILVILSKNLTILGRFFWKRRVIFHHLVRRFLWRLTLAKCSELALFFYILLSLPLLFVLSLIGFIISICGGLRDLFYYGINILNKM